MQLRLWCPTSWQFQQTGPDFPFDVDAEDDSEELCLTPCLFRLLDVVSRVEGELVWSVCWFLAGAGGASMKGSHCGCTPCAGIRGVACPCEVGPLLLDDCVRGESSSRFNEEFSSDWSMAWTDDFWAGSIG